MRQLKRRSKTVTAGIRGGPAGVVEHDGPESDARGREAPARDAETAGHEEAATRDEESPHRSEGSPEAGVGPGTARDTDASGPSTRPCFTEPAQTQARADAEPDAR